MEHNTAFVFPGQGSQYSGMGKDVAEAFPAARRVFDDIDAALGFSISQLCFEGPDEQLKLTENTQPAILAVSSAIHAVLEERGATRRDVVAGHSLGEYSAIVSVGGLTPAEAAQIVRMRGRFMQDAVPAGTGGMAALIGPTAEEARAICEEAARGRSASRSRTSTRRDRSSSPERKRPSIAPSTSPKRAACAARCRFRSPRRSIAS